MARELLIDPTHTRARDEITIAPIPVNAYTPDITAERATFGDEALRRIGRDMILVREFESMLNAIKREGAYRGIAYVHAGPAHLSIGQEAAAVGQAFTLDPDDKVFGSHRSHGEVIAKGLSAITALADTSDELFGRLQTWNAGRTWQVLAEQRGTDGTAEDVAIDYLLYGMTAETFGRATGFNRGLGGSMHAFFPPLGIYPNNAIVGGSGPLATGAALYHRVQAQPAIVVASIGDASTGTGPVWESLNFAAMAQFRELMDAEHRGGLPIIFFVVNNFYGMGGQTIGETMAFDRLARIGAGVSPTNLHAQTVDGNNPLAVVDAMRTARKHIESGNGPVLIDCQTYRQSGHSPSDASSYRTKDEIDLWAGVDPIDIYFAGLVESGAAPRSLQQELTEWAQARIEAALRLAIDTELSPRLSLRSDPAVMASMTYNDTEIDLADAPAGDLLMPIDELPHAKNLARKSRSGFEASTSLNQQGESTVPSRRVLSGAKAITFRDALFEALLAHAPDGRLALWGEENRDWGGAFGVYRGLTELLPRHRLFNAPISEAAIVGTGVGYAMSGGRAVVELMYADFIGRAGDEIFNQMAKWQAMSGGLIQLPVVLRVSVGAKYGAQHSQDWSSMVSGVPGLKVVFPATAKDAKGLLASALAGNDPVVFFESQRLYDTVETVDPQGVPAEYYRTPIGVPNLVREGSDLTILSVGAVLSRALEAADRLAERHGLQTEVIDARTLVPFDYELLLDSVHKTGRLLCVSDANLRGSWLHNVATTVSTHAFDDLDAPVTVLGARNWIAPPAELEWEYFVTPDDIVDAVHTRIVPLAGHTVQPGPGAEGTLDEAARGI